MPPTLQALVQLGWTIVLQQEDEEYAALMDESEMDEAMTHFEEALRLEPNELEVKCSPLRPPLPTQSFSVTGRRH